VSTSVRDVVRPYGEQKLVEIADGSDEFVQAIERALASSAVEGTQERVDRFLSGMSWDRTWSEMSLLIAGVPAPQPIALPAVPKPAATTATAAQPSA
jgi:UDP-galactopyranose mutase